MLLKAFYMHVQAVMQLRWRLQDQVAKQDHLSLQNSYNRCRRPDVSNVHLLTDIFDLVINVDITKLRETFCNPNAASILEKRKDT